MEPTVVKDRNALLAFTIASILLCVYAILRCITIPITHDEAVTFSIFVPKSFFDITGYVETYGMPNNHILNTLLVKASVGLFGDSTLAIRLPNVFGFMMYAYAATRISLAMSTRPLRFACFAILMFNPYVFDFFSLARGYGMANSLLLFTIWIFYNWWQSPSEKRVFAMFMSAALMVLANFATLHVFLGLELCFALALIQKMKPSGVRNVWRSMRIPIITLLALGGILYEPFRCIMKWKTTYGGATGFWSDSILPFSNASRYGIDYGNFYLWSIGTFIALSTAGIAMYALNKIRQKQSGITPILALLLIAPAFATQIQHLILGSEFPVPRVVQFMYPLFVGVLFLTLSEINRWRILSGTVASLAGFLLLLHFASTVNLKYVYEWQYDASSRQVLDEIQEQRMLNNQQTPVQVGISWIFEPSMNYERKQKYISTIAPFTRSGVDSTYDYFYVTREDSTLLANEGKKVVLHYPISRTTLMK